MTPRRVVLAGATGVLGRHVAGLLSGSGCSFRALGRNPSKLAALNATETRVCDLTQPASLRGVCDSADVLVSCAGAPVSFNSRDRSSYSAVDDAGNANLLAEAQRAGISKIVYVSAVCASTILSTEYVASHERFVEKLSTSGLDFTVVRSTGFFYVFESLVDLASKGLLALPGRGLSKTNPIHEADVARACVEAMTCTEREMLVGGPEVFTRQRIAEIAFEVLGKRPSVRRLPGGLLKAFAKPLRWFDPRMAGLIEFGTALDADDVIAPAYGQLRLGDAMRRRAKALRER